MYRLLAVAALLFVSCGFTKTSIYTLAKSSVVRVYTSVEGGGTGFVVVAASGMPLLVTNAHICDGMIAGYIRSGTLARLVPATPIEINYKKDLCAIKAPPGLTALVMAKEPPKEGDRVYVAGHPWLLGLTVVDGYLREREWYRKGGAEVWSFEFSAPIYPGNSGSPLFNAKGEVVGVVFAGAGGIANLAVPFEDLKEFLSVY